MKANSDHSSVRFLDICDMLVTRSGWRVEFEQLAGERWLGAENAGDCEGGHGI